MSREAQLEVRELPYAPSTLGTGRRQYRHYTTKPNEWLRFEDWQMRDVILNLPVRREVASGDM
jgi:hypothetical protein